MCHTTFNVVGQNEQKKGVMKKKIKKSKDLSTNYMCVWISLILLKTENNKKNNFRSLFTQKILFICLFELFTSHEQYKRYWFLKKKIIIKRKKKKSQKHKLNKCRHQSKRSLYVEVKS